MNKLSVSLVLLAIFCCHNPASAQDEHRVTISGGYALLGYYKSASPQFESGAPAGWDVGTGFHLSPRWSVEGLLTDDHFTTGFSSLVTVRNARRGVYGGPRVMLYRGRKASVFTRALVGVTTHSWQALASGPNPLDASGAVHHAALQFGGGADIRLHSHVSARVTGDYRMTPLQDMLLSGGRDPARFGFGTLNEPRFSFGIVVNR